MVSIKVIAAECGVSIATVSKALNGQRDVSPETRQRVIDTARRLGYMPNSMARALKTNRTYNIGVLFVDEAQSGLTHEYFAAVLDSFKRQAELRGYDITFINRHVGRRSSSYLEHCRYRGVDGVVIACVQFTDPEVVELVQSDLPTVTIDHVFNNRSAVLSDNAEGMRALVEHFIALGHRRIACIHGERHSSVTEKRLASFYRTCSEHGITVPDEYVRSAEYRNVAFCAEQTRALLALPEPPTAILYPDDYSAVGGIQAIREAGLSIPGDISVAGYDGIALSQIITPSLLSYRQNTETLGRQAADLLIEQIENPRTTLPEQRVVSGNLQLGDSAAAPKR
ncbi:MAG: LacI family DNA-binding transcriptional regulator [Oscillospiraceae bacterium]|nr:LacI family DNA-binding transcriptional regulator [Oscillospiraceae bacterium]